MFGLPKRTVSFSKLRKYIKQNIYVYDGVWILKDGCMSPLKAMNIVIIRNNRRFYKNGFN